MNTYVVELKFNPGTASFYLVENVADHDAARSHVAKLIGYDPGVEVSVTETPINKNAPRNYTSLGRGND